MRHLLGAALCLALFLPQSHAQCGEHWLSELLAQRWDYKKQFLADPRSPLGQADTARIRFFPPDAAWCLSARFEADSSADASFDMPTSDGGSKRYERFGYLHFQQGQDSFTLEVYQSLALRRMPKYREHLLLPFKDLSNGGESYGGGRYIDLSISDLKSGICQVDFNRAYNPYCAYAEGYSCPLPPKANHLPFRVPAGEMQFLEKTTGEGQD